MKLAFCLYKFFPYSGLARDCLRIAEECHKRGHEVHLFTMDWQGDLPAFPVRKIAVRGWQNHQKCRSFALGLQKILATENFAQTIGFNKMPQLDWYYAADVCYQERVDNTRSFLYKLLPRYKQWKKFESQVFLRRQKTKIMLIAAKQQTAFMRYYQTEAERFFLLPPGINAQQHHPRTSALRLTIRQQLRSSLNLSADKFFLLAIGSSFKTKGIDRTIKAIASLPADLRQKVVLFIIGEGEQGFLKRLAAQHNLQTQINFLGGRADVADFLLSADLLLHAARHENTGTVLIEALIAGLPVLTLAHCGYAHFISAARAGIVLPEVFDQKLLDSALNEALLASNLTLWRHNALAYVKTQDFYSMPTKAADLIEGQNLS